MGKLLYWPACAAISPAMGLGTGQSRGRGRKIKCQHWGHGWVLDTSEVIFVSGSPSRPSLDSDSREWKYPRGGRARGLEAGIWASKVTPPSPHLHLSERPLPQARGIPPVSQLPKTGSSNKPSVTIAAVHEVCLSQGLCFSPYQLSYFLGKPRRGTLYFSTEVKFT